VQGFDFEGKTVKICYFAYKSPTKGSILRQFLEIYVGLTEPYVSCHVRKFHHYWWRNVGLMGTRIA